MKKTTVTTTISLFSFTVLLTLSCHIKDRNSLTKIFYINSYHKGYQPSDEMYWGFIDNTDTSLISLKVFYMDTKRNNSISEIKNSVDSALSSIKSFNPDILVVSDDNAVKEIISPYFNGSPLPVVFCGVNWSEDQYSLSKENITGILEKLPLKEAIQNIVKSYSGIKNIAILSENSLSEQNNMTLLDTLYRNLNLHPEYYLEDNFEDWKKAFIVAGERADLIYLPTNGAVNGWNDTAAIKFVTDNIKKPVITCDEFMMPFAVYGLTKIPGEQGQWVAETVKRIIAGEKVIDIPVASNKKSKSWYNSILGNKIGLTLSDSLLNNCTVLNNK